MSTAKTIADYNWVDNYKALGQSKALLECPFVRKNIHVDWPGTDPEATQCEAGD